MTTPNVIARNTMFNGMGRAWEAVVGLFLVAYIIARIGLENYGLWGVVAAFTGYAALLDVGVASAYAKYIAEHDARDERDALSSIVSTGFFFYVLFAGIFVAIAWPCVDALIALANRLPEGVAGDLARPELLDDLGFLVRWSLVLFAVTNCIAPFTAVQTGLQRMGISNILSVVSSFVKVAATVFFLEMGFGVRGLLYTNAIVLAVFAVASIVVAFRIAPQLRLSWSRAKWNVFLKLFRFGWRAQVARLSNLVMFETDVLVIAIVLRDFQLVGIYKIGVELANKMRQIPAILLSAIVPAASALEAQNETTKLQSLYLRASKYVAAATFPLVAFVCGSASLCLHVWIDPGEGLATAAMVAQLLCVGYIANIVPGAGVTVALGMGRADLMMKAGLISMTSNVLLTICLVYTIGFWGIPIATACSMLVSWAWFGAAMRGLVQIGPFELLRRAIAWPFAVALPGFVLACAVQWLTLGIESRAVSAAVLALLFVANGGLYIFLLRLTPFFDSYDREFISKTFKWDRLGKLRRSYSSRRLESTH